MSVTETHEVWVLRSVGGGRRPCCLCADLNEMLTPREAARMRGVSELTIYRWVEGGRTHFQEIPGRGLFVCLASLPTDNP